MRIVRFVRGRGSKPSNLSAKAREMAAVSFIRPRASLLRNRLRIKSNEIFRWTGKDLPGRLRPGRTGHFLYITARDEMLFAPTAENAQPDRKCRSLWHVDPISKCGKARFSFLMIAGIQLRYVRDYPFSLYKWAWQTHYSSVLVALRRKPVVLCKKKRLNAVYCNICDNKLKYRISCFNTGRLNRTIGRLNLRPSGVFSLF
jgi:hypothetical protein